MAVIEFDHVTKIYQLGTHQTSLREAVMARTRDLVTRGKKSPGDAELLYALDDVTFHVNKGEVLGFIGHNGAGKSTILKLLSKVTYPSSGEIRTQGRMAALIELGAGFHPDLSGRENIYMNGSILGLKKYEIEEQIDSIIDFAGLARFIDTPIKRYSSGMYVRLAFAVASHVRADLLLVDEVLSVGDIAFQQKSLAKMNQLRDTGATIVFVSHNLSAIKTFCDRVILLDHGKRIVDGTPDEAIERYEALEKEKVWQALTSAPAHADPSPAALPAGGEGQHAVKVGILNVQGTPTVEFAEHDGMIVRSVIESAQSLVNPVYQVVVRRRMDGFCCFAPFYEVVTPGAVFHGRAVLEMKIEKLLLVPGDYTLEVRVIDQGFAMEVLANLPQPFKVVGEPRDPDSGVYWPEVEWTKLPACSVASMDPGA